MKWVLASIAAVLAIAAAGANACEVGGRLQHPVAGEIYKKFGFVEHPLLHTTLLHSGLDYRGAVGAPVIAAEAGTVVVAGREGGYGNYVRIDHGNGLQTSYGHLNKIEVKQGQCVGRGEIVGSIGQTGISTGPHLHFEVLRDDRFVNPISLLPERS